MNVIVGVKINKTIFWVWHDQDVWFLDLGKIDTTLIENEVLREREGFKVLDRSNILDFLQKNIDRVVSGELLRKHLDRDDVILYPSLVIDFDNSIVYDNFPEPNNFSCALADGWKYSYDDLDEVVEIKDMYWRD